METIDDIRLDCTCNACPEQYDAYIGDEKVGYLRLRHGCFYVDNKYGKEIYNANPIGDGIFDSDEREKYLTAAKQAILDDMYPERVDDLWNELGAYIHGGLSFKWYADKLEYLKKNYTLTKNKTN